MISRDDRGDEKVPWFSLDMIDKNSLPAADNPDSIVQFFIGGSCNGYECTFEQAIEILVG